MKRHSKTPTANSPRLMPQIAEGLAKQAEQAPPDFRRREEIRRARQQGSRPLQQRRLRAKAAARRSQARQHPRHARPRRAPAEVAARAWPRVSRRCSRPSPPASRSPPTRPTGSCSTSIPNWRRNRAWPKRFKKTAAAEQAAIKFVKESKPPKPPNGRRRGSPRSPSPIAAQRGTVPGASGTACVRVGGAVYGLEAASGRLLWRRHVGFGSTGWPILDRRDVIVTDTVHNELQRLDATPADWSGGKRLANRSPKRCSPATADLWPPIPARLYVLDLKSGARIGYLQVHPAAERRAGHRSIENRILPRRAIRLACTRFRSPK